MKRSWRKLTRRLLGQDLDRRMVGGGTIRPARYLRLHSKKDNSQAAIEVRQRIHQAVTRLADHPGSGRPGRIERTRELVIAGLPYIVPYEFAANMCSSCACSMGQGSGQIDSDDL